MSVNWNGVLSEWILASFMARRVCASNSPFSSIFIEPYEDELVNDPVQAYICKVEFYNLVCIITLTIRDVWAALYLG